MHQECPVCGSEIVAFTDLADDVRERLEADPDRQGQSVSHRREKHTVCPGCELEIHGCGQPYAIPEQAVQ
jgi:C4-type Zn-finger protein